MDENEDKDKDLGETPDEEELAPGMHVEGGEEDEEEEEKGGEGEGEEAM